MYKYGQNLTAENSTHAYMSMHSHTHTQFCARWKCSNVIWANWKIMSPSNSCLRPVSLNAGWLSVNSCQPFAFQCNKELHYIIWVSNAIRMHLYLWKPIFALFVCVKWKTASRHMPLSERNKIFNKMANVAHDVCVRFNSVAQRNLYNVFAFIKTNCIWCACACRSWMFLTSQMTISILFSTFFLRARSPDLSILFCFVVCLNVYFAIEHSTLLCTININAQTDRPIFRFLVESRWLMRICFTHFRQLHAHASVDHFR